MANSIKHLFKRKNKYGVGGSLWLECEGERFFGPGRVELLELIAETGSINKAAKAMRMSYKKAWEMVNILNQQSLSPLVITQSGGHKGGGSYITEEALELITYHKKLRERFIDFLKAETKKMTL